MHNSLMTTRAVFYRTRPDEAGFDLCNEASALRLIAEPTDEQKARLVEIETGRVLVDEYKYTLGTISVLRNAKRSAYLRQSREWLQEQIGMTVSDFLNLPDTDREADYYNTLEFINGALGWATVLVGLQQIECRQIDLLSDYRTPWAVVAVPEEWATVEGFLGSIDRDLLRALTDKVDQLNPGMLLISMSTDAKKYGVVSAI